jgi:hypothetical protein
MSSLAAKQAMIDEINAILNAGVSRASVGGVTTEYDLEALAKQRDRIMREIAPSVRRGRYNPYYQGR